MAVSSMQINVDDLAREKVAEVEKLLSESKTDLSSSVINSWISIMKSIVTAAELHRTNNKNSKDDKREESEGNRGESIYADYVDDNEQFHTTDLNEQLTTNPVKWTIRVQAFKLIHRLVNLLISKQTTTAKTPLLRHLPDLIRLSFVAATSPYDDLKVQGFEMFKLLINELATVEEAEFPGHSILEQYKIQVISALKPAFEPDAPPYITAIATQVCCLWICRRLEKDNLQRTFSLMEMTIGKLNQQSVNHNNKLYTESELEQERLDILGCWAQLYFTAQEPRLVNDNTFKELFDFVQPHIHSLVDKWWEALKDYALLILPKPRAPAKTHENGHVYTREVALKLFEPIWPKLILAVTTQLCSSTNLLYVKESQTDSVDSKHTLMAPRYTQFICSIIMKEICKSLTSCQNQELPESTMLSLKSLAILVKHPQASSFIIDKFAMTQEFYAILYKLLILSRNKSQLILLLSLIEQFFSLTIHKMSYREAKLIEDAQLIVEHLKRNPIKEKNLTKTLVAINNLSALLNAYSNQECDDLLRKDVIQICQQIAEESKETGMKLEDPLIEILGEAKTLLMNRIFKPNKPVIQSVPKPTVKLETKPAKRAPKINLKKDFSNFYTVKNK